MNFTQWQKLGFLRIGGGIALVVALACLNYSLPAQAQESKEAQKMDMQHTNWKTWCLGRFIIELPPEAVYEGGHINYDYYLTITTTPMEPPAFQAMLKKRHDELKAIKHRKAPVYLFDASVIKDIPLSGLFTFYSDPASTILVKLEAYRLMNGLSYKVVGEATPDRLGLATQGISDLMKRLAYRDDHEIPDRTGFCFKNGFFPDTGIKAELLSASFSFKDHPDVSLNIDTDVRDVDNAEEPLIKKIEEGKKEGGVAVASVKTLRKGDRKLDDSPGQEILLKGPMDSGHVGHGFIWEAIGLPNDNYHPQIHIDFSTANTYGQANGPSASLSDDEAIALWDHMLHSFKLRPTTAPVGSAETPVQKVKLGTSIRTGQVCPQNGIWESTTGGQKVFIREGENVPHAIVKSPVSRWQKLKGASSSEYVETTWVLSEYRDKNGKPLA